ncbi:PepSY domain-containing protein [Catellicoccus marimammalium]|uniref:PepSY domain-containing protein n=1 Tax=Catellicoccus marimammalium TaxID=300419 RepID=UPI00058B2BA7|nr:PepSY domain-containing protein [Catellicoccus marimammalium]
MKLKTLWITIISLFICAGILGVILYESRELNKNLSAIRQSKKALNDSSLSSNSEIRDDSQSIDETSILKNEVRSIEPYTDLDFIKKIKEQEKGELLEVKVEYEGNQPVYQIKLQKRAAEWEGIFNAQTKKLLYTEQEEEYDNRTMNFSSIRLNPKKAISFAKKKVGGIPTSWQLELEQIGEPPIYTIDLKRMEDGKIEEAEVKIDSGTGKVISVEKELDEIDD